MEFVRRLLYFQPDGKHAPIKAGQTLLDVAQALGVEISAVCGGEGTCAKCKVIVKDGGELLGRPTTYETNSLVTEDLDFGYRLACEAVITGDGLITVEVPEESRGSKHRLQSEGLDTHVELEPLVNAFQIVVEPPSLESPESMYEMVVQALRNLGVGTEEVDHGVLVRMGPTLRRLGWKASAVMYDDRKLIGLAESGTPVLGMAFDIGTTKLAGYLMDLTTGKLLSKVSRVNPQVVYGEDVMTRLAYVLNEKEGLHRLVRSIRDAINEMVGEACSAAAFSRENVREMVLAGNTLMHHLVLGLEPSSLGVSPYSPVIKSSYAVEGEAIGLSGEPGLIAYMLPNVAGFVGADCVGDVIATGLDSMGGNGLLVDIGTNTEMVLCSQSAIWCASSPSGPTFEGAHVKHGMRALSGAIEHISIDGLMNVTYSTIDGAPAKGICGSGVVDAVSEMAKKNILERSGRMKGDGTLKGVVRGQSGLEYLVSSAPENAIKRDITITQGDVREVQKAKAAIATGIKILLSQAGLAARDLDHVYVAGAFGSYIDMPSAISMGMLPALPLRKMTQVGNAAGTGARMCLLSRRARRVAEDTAKRMRYVELATWVDFQQTFLKSLELAPYS